MTNFIKLFFEVIKILNSSQLLEIKNIIFPYASQLSDKEFLSYIYSHVENREKLCCPHCNSKYIVKYGLNALKNQRYKCKDCTKYFCNRTNTPMSYSKKTMENWFEYFKLMCKTTTIRDCALELKINTVTAFQWRHKILNSIMPMLPSKLEGTVEINEVFFTESFKGNHSRDWNFEMNRKPIKRQMTLSEKLNSRKVSVLCCQDRQENLFAKTADRHKTSFIKMHELLGDKIKIGSTLCTNNNIGYVSLAKKLNCKLYKMRDYSEIKEGKFHIQNASIFAEEIKFNINEKFRGVATKYLNFYLAWLQWLETMKNKKDTIKVIDILTMCIFSNRKLPCYEFKTVRSII